MATYHPSITDEQAELIRNAPVFFVASAAPNLARGPHDVGPVNVSVKGGVPLHILGPNRVAYLDYRGSGNETARHCSAGGPVTVIDGVTAEGNEGYPHFEPARVAMGDTRRYAERIGLINMAPWSELSSTGYALAKPGEEYLVLQPSEKAEP